MVVIAVIIPKLELKEKTDSELDEYAQNKITKLTGNAPFAAVNPLPASVKTTNDAFHLAIAAAQHGSEAQTLAKDNLRAALEEKLTLQANDCAHIAVNDHDLFATTGYQEKDLQGHPVGELEAPTEILFRKYGEVEGQLRPDWNSIPHAKNYTVQVVTDVAHPNTTVVAEQTESKSKATIDGLPSGTMVYTRVRANGGSTGKSPWSALIAKRVP
jgi:hypothetical protein